MDADTCQIASVNDQFKHWKIVTSVILLEQMLKNVFEFKPTTSYRVYTKLCKKKSYIFLWYIVRK